MFNLKKYDTCEFYNQKAFKLLNNNEWFVYFFLETKIIFSFKYEINCLYAYYILKSSAIIAIENKNFQNAISNFQKMLNLYELRRQIFPINEKENHEFCYSKEFLNIYYQLYIAHLVIF